MVKTRTDKVVEDNEGQLIVRDPRESHPELPGVAEKVVEQVFLYKCSCGNVHFRHAEYVELMIPYLEPGKKEVTLDSKQVMLCIRCRKAFAWIHGQAYDLSNKIDVKVKAKTEKAAHKTTRPGDQC